jgi:uncharacterized protein YjbJ (UPF0337 family)
LFRGWQHGGGTNLSRYWREDFRIRWGRKKSPPVITQGSSSTACRTIAGVCFQEQFMSINKDQVNGRVKEAEGKIKEVAGALVGNKKMEVKGKVKKNLGKAQAKYGDIKQDVKDIAKPA